MMEGIPVFPARALREHSENLLEFIEIIVDGKKAFTQASIFTHECRMFYKLHIPLIDYNSSYSRTDSFSGR